MNEPGKALDSWRNAIEQLSPEDTTEAAQEQKSAQERYDEASNYENSIKREMELRQREEIAAVNDRIRATYADVLAEAASRRTEAERTLNEERIATLADKGPTVGSRYVEYKPPNSLARTRQLTGRVAIVEQRIESTRFADNISSYMRLNMGEKFLRILKKDGTPGIQVARLGRLDWIPEGTEKKS